MTELEERAHGAAAAEQGPALRDQDEGGAVRQRPRARRRAARARSPPTRRSASSSSEPPAVAYRATARIERGGMQRPASSRRHPDRSPVGCDHFGYRAMRDDVQPLPRAPRQLERVGGGARGAQPRGEEGAPREDARDQRPPRRGRPAGRRAAVARGRRRGADPEDGRGDRRARRRRSARRRSAPARSAPRRAYGRPPAAVAPPTTSAWPSADPRSASSRCMQGAPPKARWSSMPRRARPGCARGRRAAARAHAASAQQHDEMAREYESSINELKQGRALARAPIAQRDARVWRLREPSLLAALNEAASSSR